MLLIGSLSFAAFDSKACTSVIVSGKITPDGRPILFKHRDATSGMRNLPLLVQGERYRYIGLFNAADRKMKSAWGGHNETGFAIINTAAYNLNGPEGIDSNGDGALMKRALEICSSLKDFETLLCFDLNILKIHFFQPYYDFFLLTVLLFLALIILMN